MKLEEFLNVLISEFKKQNIKYCILRNYKTLPYILLNGDIDVLVEKQNIEKVSNIINSIQTISIIGKTKRSYVHNYFIYNIDKGAKSNALQIDFIFNYVYKGINYLNIVDILDSSIEFKNGLFSFQIANPFYESLSEFMPYYLSSGVINKKYKDNVLLNLKKSEKEFIQTFRLLDTNVVNETYQNVLINDEHKIKETSIKFRNQIFKKYFKITTILNHFCIEILLLMPFINSRIVFTKFNSNQINEINENLESFAKDFVFINILSIKDFSKLFSIKKNFTIYLFYINSYQENITTIFTTLQRKLGI